MSTEVIDPSVAAIVGAILGAAVTGYFTRRQTRNAELQTYQKLEMASIELFRFEAAHARICARLRDEAAHEPESLTAVERVELIAYLTQLLNLFEMAVSFRKGEILPRDAFASWIAWILETCSSETFQKEWRFELQPHYSKDLNRLVEAGIVLVQKSRNVHEEVVAQKFYELAAAQFGDDALIREWRVQ